MPLGKGLGALLAPTGRSTKHYQTGAVSSAPTASGGEKVWQIPVSEITPNPHQPRRQFSAPELNELAQSIKAHGVLQPILVSERADGGYELISGERRLRAAKLAGLPTVPALVRSLANDKKLEVALIENIQRENLNPLEEAFAFKRLTDEFGLTQQQVADKVGKSRPAVANALRLLDLSEAAQSALMAGKISAGQGRALLMVGDAKQQLELLASMLGEKISVRELEKTARARNGGARARRDPNLTYLEDKLRSALNTKVSITQKGGRGAIGISYYSPEELKRLISQLTR